MPTLSVVMIVKNEAHCLRRCLESVRPVADEIIVADTGSTDDTVAIAEACQATVFSIPWKNDFAAARNQTLEAATGDWLLHMDADEMLDPEGAQALRDLVDRDGDGADAIELTLANYCNDPRAWRWVAVAGDNPYTRGHAGYIAVPLLRLFRNHRGFEYREPIHENITESVVEQGGKIASAPILIHHYGYDIQATRQGEKAALYLAIAKKKMETHPENLKALHDYAEQALACGQTDEAERICRQALTLQPNDLDSVTTLSNILLNRGDWAEARTLLEGYEQALGAPPHVVSALGAIACHEGRLEEAETRLKAVIAHDPGAVMARYYYARTLDLMGQGDAAQTELNTICTAFPMLPEFRDRADAHHLRLAGEASFGRGKAQAALSKLVQALQRDPEDPVTHNDLGVVFHTLGKPDEARKSFERALLIAPGYGDAQENLQALK